MIKHLRSFFAVAAFAATAACTHAAITVTFTGTFNGPLDSDYGYVVGEDYTFSYTLHPDWSTGAQHAGTSNHIWWEYSSEHDPLFSAVSGSGVSGIYTGNYASIEVNENSSQTIFGAGDMDSMQSIGLVAPDGTSGISWIQAYVISGISHAVTGESMDFNDYFASFSGDYAVEGSIELSMVVDGFGGMGPSFNLTNVNISAVPEPSTYAAILGAGALGLMVWRRRRQG